MNYLRLKDSHERGDLLSAVYLSQQKYDEAVAAGEKTIVLDPNGSENHAIVVILMQNVGKFEQAISLLKHAIM